MTSNHSNTKRKQAKHLSDIQRGRLEEMAKEGKLSQTKMVLELGVDQSTISRELRRGKFAKWLMTALITNAIRQRPARVFIRKIERDPMRSLLGKKGRINGIMVCFESLFLKATH